MKGRGLAAVLALALACLTACGRSLSLGEKVGYDTNTFPGASMAVEADTVTATGAALTITNETGGEILSGNRHDFVVQAEKDGDWYDIETGEWANTAEAWVLPEGVTDMEASWADRYGALPKGHYRIVKGFWTEGAVERSFRLSAEFDVD